MLALVIFGLFGLFILSCKAVDSLSVNHHNYHYVLQGSEVEVPTEPVRTEGEPTDSAQDADECSGQPAV